MIIQVDPASSLAERGANGTYKPPAPPDPDYLCDNVIDIESELLKIRGDRDDGRGFKPFVDAERSVTSHFTGGHG